MFLVIVQKQQQYVTGHASFWAVRLTANRVSADKYNAWCDDTHSRSASLPLETAISCLEDYNNRDDSSDETRQINFIIEQLKLLSTNNYKRHYSPELIVCVYIIHASSAAAYEVLHSQQVLCLPSVSTLARITRLVNSNSGLDNASYLQLRVSQLNDYQKNVLVIIDEVYIAKRVEYSAGEVQGLTADETVASTLLCFMSKFVIGKYKDVVAIYPMATLTAAKQHESYHEVMENVNRVGLNVVAIFVDNASTNRKFFTDFTPR